MISILLVAVASCASRETPAQVHQSGDDPPRMTADEAAEAAIERTGAGLGEAAMSPLEDVNLKRDPIPSRLARLETPYGLPDPVTCQTLKTEIAALTRLIGHDRDLPTKVRETDEAEWAADKSSDLALNTVESGARSVIPLRGLVRDASGASAHSRRHQRAYRLGAERRAYLKGVGQAMGCTWPSAPLPHIGRATPRKIQYRNDTPQDETPQ